MKTKGTQRVQHVQGLRRSNAATAIPSRKVRRQGSRSAARRASIKED
jgi:hypothetical protein